MNLKSFFDAVSPISDTTWEEIEPLFRKEHLAQHDHFTKTNETATRIAFLESGIVRAYFTNREGKEYNKQFFVAPTVIGAYTSLLKGSPNLIAQQAMTDCIIWTINYNEITNRYNAFPDLERLSRKMAEYYFLEKEKKELDIVLLNAAERYQIFQKEFPGIEQHITQYHVASYLGISPIQLSRIRHPKEEK
ncbi:Crp/Fnr family transcriptional regulator [Chryseotalea sanaruensis]|uniref:Crp/Fnr family transcriptional regulator n=1 Tax=Chryseotalea sanaruensis TaxID=2482724 RepID=A0A401U6F0_9BACT|nr:Crp/Fnr family transcriptional regulator [Chryseotalea sanaruensis]GCC50508.1 Crp/Fnr family transcriptional regulator [Chryseotalea sanaruensis]